MWLRGGDLNPRPLGYEPNELPDCSTPRHENPSYHARETVHNLAQRHERSHLFVISLTRRNPIPKTPSLLMKRGRAIAIIGAFAGGLLFAYTLHAVGLAVVVGQTRQIGAGFLLVLLLSGIRMAVRSQAWTLCVEPPAR